MDDLEELRKRRLEELRAQQGAPSEAESAQRKQAERAAAVEGLLQQLLDNEARERLERIRMSRPDLFDAVTRQLVALAQSGRLNRRLGDADLRQLLEALAPKDRDIRITRR